MKINDVVPAMPEGLQRRYVREGNMVIAARLQVAARCARHAVQPQNHEA